MMTLKRLALTPSADWWLRIRPMVHEFETVIGQAPAKSLNNARDIAQQVKELYSSVQEMPCPYDAELLYTYLTRAMLYLCMCYESLSLFQWNQVEVFYGRATSDWTLTRAELRNQGIAAKAS